jgi:hypothetical protein
MIPWPAPLVKAFSPLRYPDPARWPEDLVNASDGHSPGAVPALISSSGRAEGHRKRFNLLPSRPPALEDLVKAFNPLWYLDRQHEDSLKAFRAFAAPGLNDAAGGPLKVLQSPAVPGPAGIHTLQLDVTRAVILLLRPRF